MITCILQVLFEFNSRFCAIHWHIREQSVLKMCAGVCACVFISVSVSHAHTFVYMQVFLRGCLQYRNSTIKLWLRTSALRVLPVETRLTVYRRYHTRP
jgi:hypothetical protein